MHGLFIWRMKFAILCLPFFHYNINVFTDNIHESDASIKLFLGHKTSAIGFVQCQV